MFLVLNRILAAKPLAPCSDMEPESKRIGELIAWKETLENEKMVCGFRVRAGQQHVSIGGFV